MLRRQYNHIWIECIFIALLAGVFYVSLYSELPIDDTNRFTDDIAAGRYQWDPTHLFMQPATVLWHQYLNFGTTALISQHHINTFCALVSLVVFYLLLLRLDVIFYKRLVLTLIAAVSFNVLNLATSGHMKLTAYPFLSLALYHAFLWEHNIKQNPQQKDNAIWRLLISAVFLGIASLFLINSIVILPFLCIAILCITPYKSASFNQRLKLSILYGLICAIIVVGVIGLFYYILTKETPTLSGFISFVVGNKKGERYFFSIKESTARLGFGTLLNFVYTENLGPILRVWLNRQIPSFTRYINILWKDIVIAGGMLFILGWVYISGGIQLYKRTIGFTAWAFLLGSLSFAFWWNLSEAEFFFQITLPTLVIASLIPYNKMYRGIVTIWLIIAIISNVVFWAIPKKSYPFNNYIIKLQQFLKPNDLTICFAAYPGKQCMGFFLPYLKDRDMLVLDQLLLKLNDKNLFFSELRERVDDALSRTSHIYVFQAFDEEDWNAPWPMFLERGLTKDRLIQFFHEHYNVHYIGEVVGIKCWELYQLR